jgi:hypothetical protein
MSIDRDGVEAYELALEASVYFEAQPQLFHVFAYLGLAVLKLKLDPSLADPGQSGKAPRSRG